jgi:hypothetical protein
MKGWERDGILLSVLCVVFLSMTDYEPLCYFCQEMNWMRFFSIFSCRLKMKYNRWPHLIFTMCCTCNSPPTKQRASKKRGNESSLFKTHHILVLPVPIKPQSYTYALTCNFQALNAKWTKNFSFIDLNKPQQPTRTIMTWLDDTTP